MKKLALVLSILALVVPTWADEEQVETLVDAPTGRGGFGGPVLKITEINDEFGLLIGGRGAWIINHTFTVGGGIYTLVDDIKVEDLRFDRSLEFSYGGLELGIIVGSHRLVHLSFQALAGFGGLADQIASFDRIDGFDSPDDTFFVMEPGANLMWNVTSYFRIGLGGSYRFIRGVSIGRLNNADLSGGSIVLTFKLGRF